MLDLFESKDYKDGYEFLDQLQPLNKHDPRIPGLESQLVQRLKESSSDRISIAFPEMPNEEALDHYKVTCGGSVDMQELTLEGIYDFIKTNDLAAEPEKIYVVGIGDNDAAVTRRRSLRDYLACEFDHENETFLFCNGEWYQAEKDYVKSTRAKVAALSDLTAELALLPIKNGEKEGEYNERLAAEGDLLLMDKANFQMGGSHDKSEVCDLLMQDADMICVKKMEDSCRMSHLFSQGSVSATMLCSEPKYRDNLNNHAKKKWPAFCAIGDYNMGRARIVYAVATCKNETLAEGMFFFSLINLLNHVRTIQLTGCKVALCKIDYDTAPAKPTASKRKKKAGKKKAKEAK